MNLVQLSTLPSVVQLFFMDRLTYKGVMTARWGGEILDSMQQLRENANDISFPLLLLQGTEDNIVSPQGAQWLFDHCNSRSRHIQFFQGAAHDLFWDISSNEALQTIQTWVEDRIKQDTR